MARCTAFEQRSPRPQCPGPRGSGTPRARRPRRMSRTLRLALSVPSNAHSMLEQEFRVIDKRPEDILRRLARVRRLLQLANDQVALGLCRVSA